MLLTAPATKRAVSNHKLQYQRPRLESHFVQTPQILLGGYPDLSDGAKLTYLVLLSFDYLDAESDGHKGIVYPSIETLMAIRGKGKSTIYAHLAELEKHGLAEVLIGEGIRLYNPLEGEIGEDRRLCPSTSQTAVTASHSGSQSPSRRASDEISGRDKDATSPTLTFQKSGRLLREEEENQETEQYQYSEAGERELVVEKLRKLGFELSLARQFAQRYGPERIDEQITNLCRALQSGVQVQSYPRWLYRAIERDYTFSDVPAVPSAPSSKRRKSLGHERLLPTGEVVYEVLEYPCVG